MNKLHDIEKIINWEPIEKKVDYLFESFLPSASRKAVSLRSVLKLLYIQHLYKLSDLELEDRMIDKASYRRFAGIRLNQEAHYGNVLWSFKEVLEKGSFLQEIFKEVNEQVKTEKRGVRKEKNAVFKDRSPGNFRERPQIGGYFQNN